MSQILLESYTRETCISFGSCSYSKENECGTTRKYTMKSRHIYGYIREIKYYVEKYRESIYLKIQPQNRGSERQITMEGVDIYYFNNENIVR